MARRTTHTEAWWANASPTILRCTAHYKDGTPCRREASAGANVCGQHGALAPAVQAAAATRIQMSVDEAAERLIAWMNDASVDIRERVKIAHDLLDRGGLGATSKVLLGVVTEDPVERLFRDLLAQDGILAAPPSEIEPGPQPPQPAAIDAAQPDDVVDAEIIEEPAAQHTVHVEESMSAAPPKHLRADLDRAELLRSLL